MHYETAAREKRQTLTKRLVSRVVGGGQGDVGEPSCLPGGAPGLLYCLHSMALYKTVQCINLRRRGAGGETKKRTADDDAWRQTTVRETDREAQLQTRNVGVTPRNGASNEPVILVENTEDGRGIVSEKTVEPRLGDP